MTGTVLITDCDMGEADLERSELEPAGYRVVHMSCRDEDEVVEQVRATSPVGLLVQYAPITRPVIGAAVPDVRGVVRYGVGLDNVDLDAAAEHGVEVSNVHGYGSAEVADHAMALLLSALRGIPAWSGATGRGAWPARGAFADPAELRECQLGLVGFGAVAREVAIRAKSFGMSVASYDPYTDDDAFTAIGVRRVGWHDLWATSTAVSLHAPLSSETRRAVDAATLGAGPPGQVLVNTARAELVDRDALVDALDSGQVAMAALDVWWSEPASPDDALLTDDRVLVTPHIAWLSSGSTPRLRVGAARRLLTILEGAA